MNQTDEDGRNALHWAIIEGNTEVVKALCTITSSTSSKLKISDHAWKVAGNFGKTALNYASEWENQSGSKNQIEMKSVEAKRSELIKLIFPYEVSTSINIKEVEFSIEAEAKNYKELCKRVFSKDRLTSHKDFLISWYAIPKDLWPEPSNDLFNCQYHANSCFDSDIVFRINHTGETDFNYHII